MSGYMCTVVNEHGAVDLLCDSECIHADPDPWRVSASTRTQPCNIHMGHSWPCYSFPARHKAKAVPGWAQDPARADPTTGEESVQFPLIPMAVRYQHKYSDDNLHPHGDEANIGVKKEYHTLQYW